MASVFKKLISNELGENNYYKYFFSYQNRMINQSEDAKKIENREVFEDIYNLLKNEEMSRLEKKQERLTDALYLSLRINKTYLLTLIFYLLATLFIIGKQLIPSVTIASLLIMSICFLYKTYEFVVNKFSFIDAHIIIVYKSVLDKLVGKPHNRTDN